MDSVARRLLISFSAFLVAASLLYGQVAWVSKYDLARQLAKSRNQLIVVDVYATWCGPCKQMERTVFPDPSFVELSQNLVCLRVDAENDSDGRMIAGRFEVHSYPTILVLDAEGREISRLVGFSTASALVDDLNEILADPRPLKEIEQQAQANQDDYQAQYAAGSRLLEREQGKKAIPYLRRALQLADDSKERIECLTRLFRATTAERQFEESLKALEELEKLLPEARQSGELQGLKAQALIALGRDDEAFNLLDQLIRSSTGQDRQMARELLKDLPKKYQKTDKELTKSLKKVGDLILSGKVEEALLLALKAIETAPQSPEAHMAVAGAYFRSSETQTDPATKSAYLTAGLDHMRLSRRLDPDSLTLYQAAKSALASRYIPLLPSSPEAAKIFENAEGAFAAGRYDEAAKLYEKVFAIEPFPPARLAPPMTTTDTAYIARSFP